MRDRALAPSPVALFLLGLAERRADGQVEVGGRRLLLARGQVMGLEPAEGDGDLETFLLDAGRLDAAQLAGVRARVDAGTTLDEALATYLSRDELWSATRALWLDRLVRGLARASAEGAAAAPVQALPHIPEGGPRASLLALVLDALERRAAAEDAGWVGGRPTFLFAWIDGPSTARAHRWSDLGGEDLAAAVPVATLLRREPAAASRIAALVRAGLATVRSPDAAAPPAPARRPPSVFPTPPSSPSIPALSSTPPAPEEARVAPAVRLDPGLVRLFETDRPPPLVLADTAAPIVALEDPLDPIEQRIAALEEGEAPGAERAAAWRAFAETWRERFGSLEEAARAYREAVGADPTDLEALEGAASLCTAIGQGDYGVAYARAAVHACDDEARVEALLHFALLCRRLGKVSEALDAVREAAASDPDRPRAFELAVHLWRDLEQHTEAAEAAVEAARRHGAAGRRRRALALQAIAYAAAPGSPERAEAYARGLAAAGYPEASIGVRGAAERRTQDADTRRTLLLAAAEQAELAERPAMASRLLQRAFDHEPHLDLLYEPLDADLAAAQSPIERALLLEEIAATSHGAEQASWLRRAADLRLALPGDGDWEAELRARALELAPTDAATRSAIAEQALAHDDERLFVDALERAVLRGRWQDVDAQVETLVELAERAEGRLGAPARAAWAWARVKALVPGDRRAAEELERLSEALRAHREGRKALERTLQDGGGDRLATVRALAEHLRDDPDRRGQAIGLYREVLEADPRDGEAAKTLERLLRLTGDEGGQAAVLNLRLDAAGRTERLRHLLRIASLQAFRGHFREAAEACKALLGSHGTHREASLRLRRAARRLGDREMLREALAAEAQLALPARERARTLTDLAVELEYAGAVAEAIDCAESALKLDPSQAEAALLVLRHLDALKEPQAALGVVRALFGESPPILEASARVAWSSGEHDVLEEALEAWATIAPLDPEPWRMRLEAAMARGAGLRQAVEGALVAERLVPSLARPVTRALEVLAEVDAPGATELTLAASDAFGGPGEELRELARRLAFGLPDGLRTQSLRLAALERCVAVQDGAEKVATLRTIAALHRERGDRAAEARTHLRVLAMSTRDASTLARLGALYAETGERERLGAVLALELEGEPTPEKRRGTLLRLASAARAKGDLEQSEAFLREVATAATDDDPSPLLDAAFGLAELGRAREAVRLLREGARGLGDPDRAALRGRAVERVYREAVRLALRGLEDARVALDAAVEGLDRVPGSSTLLVAFETLALQLKDVDLAERTYGSLLERAMGPHGRQALAYRQGRWLEQVRAPRSALAAYERAFDATPSAGALYASIERLARAEDRVEVLAWATRQLAERAGHPAVRAEMTRRAARLLEEELGRPAEAFEVLRASWEQTGDRELEPVLARLAPQLEDPAAGVDGLVATLRGWADEAWLADEKARLLQRAARLTFRGLGDLEAAAHLVEEGYALAFAEDGEAEVRASLRAELAAWALDAGDSSAAVVQAQAALADVPTHEGARGLLEELGVTPAPRHVPTSPGLGAEGSSEGLAVVRSRAPKRSITRDFSRDSIVGLEAAAEEEVAPEVAAPQEAAPREATPREATPREATPREATPHQATPQEATPREATPREATPPDASFAVVTATFDPSSESATGDGPPAGRSDSDAPELMVSTMDEAFEDLDEGLGMELRAEEDQRRPSWVGRPAPEAGVEAESRAATLLARGQGPEAMDMLAELLAYDPGRLSSLRLYQAAAAVSGDERREALVRSVLALVDLDLSPPDPLVFAPEDDAAEGPWRSVEDVFGLLWEGAGILFREARVSRNEGDRVTRVATDPRGGAFVEALDRLGIDDLPLLYAPRTAPEGLEIHPATPPYLFAGTGLAGTAAELRFAFGSALIGMAPPYLLVSTLERARLETVCAAVEAAFGPTDGGPVPREAASLAAELWNTLPTAHQNTVRRLLDPIERWQDLDGYVRHVATRRAIGGLVACGDLGVALRSVLPSPPASEEELGRALGETRVAAALMRFALVSDAPRIG
jgi:hypothetical protein